MKQRLAQLDNVEFDNQHPSQGDRRQELIAGLQKSQKIINPKFFYDAKGSGLFDQITRLAEYYPTRTEKEILKRFAGEIAAYCGTDCVLIEPGSGSSEKVRLLLDTLKPQVYVPLDISADFLYQSAVQLGEEFPWLNIHAICADFSHNWSMARDLPEGKRVIFYPGSTIGNLEPSQAVTFLLRFREWMEADGGALIGVDLHKSTQILNAAYNDDHGVTARFNLNVLTNINTLLNTRFDVNKFEHRAFYNTDKQRIEMHLVSKFNHTIECDHTPISFREGETIHTENSYKYTVKGFAELAAKAGLDIRQSWLDDEQLFSLHYLEPNAG